MRARDRWKISSDWDGTAREDFDHRMRRVHQPWIKWQNLLTKARVLFATGDAQKRAGAVDLLARTLTLPGIDAGCVSYSLNLLGEFAEATGDVEAALRYYRKAIKVCPRGRRGIVGQPSPEANLARLRATRQTADHEAP